MKEISKELLVNCANSLMFEMKEEEYQTLKEEFDIIQAQFLKIGEIEGLNDVEPMTFPFDASIEYLREDIPSTPLPREEVLSNAKDVLGGQIRLPKVVG